jgi:protocatechuate 3,4-dioxygenase beta subunit
MQCRKVVKMVRRQFIGLVALSLAASRFDAEEPFDSLPPGAWRHARNNGLVMIRRPAPSELSSRTQIVGKDEPGQPLIVSGAVVAPDGKTPAAGVTVYAYNTDAKGYYGQNQTEFPPRLYGWMKTDAHGHFELRTILPGQYPGMRVPAHIHFSLWGAGYPLQWVDELRFEGDPYITPAMLGEAVQPLAQGKDGALRCGYKIRLQSKGNFT